MANCKIILLGFMGCGKSTIARMLAQKLDFKFLDLDDVIEQEAKQKISSIFKEKGESHFRKLESKCLSETLAQKGNCVIALGGGTPCFHNNMKKLLKYDSFYLQCSPEVLSKRLIKEKSHRPVIAAQTKKNLLKFVRHKLKERREYYKAARFIIQGHRSPNKIVKRIQTLLDSKL